MIEKSKLIYRKLMVRITLWLAHRLGLEEVPPGWVMFNPEVAKERGIEAAIIDANPDGDKEVQA